MNLRSRSETRSFILDKFFIRQFPIRVGQEICLTLLLFIMNTMMKNNEHWNPKIA